MVSQGRPAVLSAVSQVLTLRGLVNLLVETFQGGLHRKMFPENKNPHLAMGILVKLELSLGDGLDRISDFESGAGEDLADG